MRASPQLVDNHDFPMHRSFSACPGRELAEEIVFTTIASILAVFNIAKVKDAKGKDITPSGEYSTGSIM